MDKNPMLAYLHVRKAIQMIEDHLKTTQGKMPEYGLEYLGIERLLETLADATAAFPEPIKAQYPHIEWRKIKSFRNFLAHDYLDEIDEEVMKQIIETHLPVFKKTVEEMIENHD